MPIEVSSFYVTQLTVHAIIRKNCLKICIRPILLLINTLLMYIEGLSTTILI